MGLPKDAFTEQIRGATQMPTVIAVMAGAALVVVALMAYGHLRTQRAERATITPEGRQEATITIHGRYHPDTIHVVQGMPVRLHFLRKEDNPCSERVVFSTFGVDRRLPAFQETIVEFVPFSTGTFLFTCQWGMYRGKLVVMASRGRTKALHG